jgi:hypothetical protein
LKLTLPDSLHRFGGAPSVVWSHIEFPPHPKSDSESGSEFDVEHVYRKEVGKKLRSQFRFQFHIYNKTATRLPEAHWVKFKPLLRMEVFC